MSEWLPTHADLSSSLLNQSIRNPKGKGVANKDRKSAADSSNDSLAPSAVSQGSRKQCQHERNPELAENDVPRRKRNHAATVVLPPMNSSRHLLVEGIIDCAKQSDHEQPNLAKPFPQSQSDVSELHCHNFPGQRHPKRGSPDQWPAANRVIQHAGVIDQPRIGRKLAKSDYDSKKKESSVKPTRRQLSTMLSAAPVRQSDQGAKVNRKTATTLITIVASTTPRRPRSSEMPCAFAAIRPSIYRRQQ